MSPTSPQEQRGEAITPIRNKWVSESPTSPQEQRGEAITPIRNKWVSDQQCPNLILLKVTMNSREIHGKSLNHGTSPTSCILGRTILG
ncbi:hypothetical protein QE152_g35825 [Popillia japonica]|uniref:Uncharacterized protein n=1 Tax=Popillia japonica TaxID=7064 RepID=A0AAW1IEM7_POPJA